MARIPGVYSLQRAIKWVGATYRSRISIQLIASSVLVVLLTILLIEMAIVGILIWRTDPPDDRVTISEQLGEQAAAAATRITAEDLADSLGPESMTTEDERQLDAILSEIINDGLPTESDRSAQSLGANAHAAIVNDRGVIVASTDSTWATPDDDYNRIDFAPGRVTVGRALGLRGDSTAYENTFVLDYLDDTMAASHPIFAGDDFTGVILLQADGVVEPRLLQQSSQLLALAGANALGLAALTIPALIVAIPIGIRRARRISQRLEHLSEAAGAMAAGDLDVRVEINGTDEVAQVGQRFNTMVERLAEADRARRAFVSNVSHELRTPVAILRGNLEQLRDSPELTADRADLMYREMTTLGQLIDDLFTVARIEEAVMPVEIGPVDVGACIKQVVRSTASLAWDQRRVSVEAMVEDNVPPALGEQVRIQQVLNNLLQNALRHTPEGGLIVAGCRAVESGIETTVADTGLGIPSDELPYIFDRYRQVEQSERSHDGSGLGLAIVKQLVEAMNGQITVESTLNQGTTFRIVLPVA